MGGEGVDRLGGSGSGIDRLGSVIYARLAEADMPCVAAPCNNTMDTTI